MIPMKIGARGWYVMLIRGAGNYDTYGKLRHGKLVSASPVNGDSWLMWYSDHDRATHFVPCRGIYETKREAERALAVAVIGGRLNDPAARAWVLVPKADGRFWHQGIDMMSGSPVRVYKLKFDAERALFAHAEPRTVMAQPLHVYASKRELLRAVAMRALEKESR